MNNFILLSLITMAQASPNGWQVETSPPRCANQEDVFIERILTDGTVETICGECSNTSHPFVPSHWPAIYYVKTSKRECTGFNVADGEESADVPFNEHASPEACAKACFGHWMDEAGEHGFIYGLLGSNPKCYCERGSVGGNETNNIPLEPCTEATSGNLMRYEYTTACDKTISPNEDNEDSHGDWDPIEWIGTFGIKDWEWALIIIILSVCLLFLCCSCRPQSRPIRTF